MAPGVYFLLTLNCLPDTSLSRPRRLHPPKLGAGTIPQITCWLWSQPEGLDEQAEPKAGGPLYEHSTRTSSQERRGHRQSPGSWWAKQGPGQGDRGEWWHWSGNASTRPLCPKVRGITIGSLLQSSKASLTTPPKASLQDAQHASPPPPQPPSFLQVGHHCPKDLQFGPSAFSSPPT